MLTVRAARPEDAADVARVHVRSWQAAYRGLLDDEHLDGLRPEDRAARYTFHLVGPDQPATAVALEDDEIRGFVTTGPARGCAQTVGEVYAINVDPSAWRRGVGRALMAHARSRLASRGFTRRCSGSSLATLALSASTVPTAGVPTDCNATTTSGAFA
jgi:GNAT superfamily N-acetyltransferase